MSFAASMLLDEGEVNGHMVWWFGLYIGMVIILKKSVRNSKHLRALTLTF